jgi:hypothetical protein
MFHDTRTPRLIWLGLDCCACPCSTLVAGRLEVPGATNALANDVASDTALDHQDTTLGLSSACHILRP